EQLQFVELGRRCILALETDRPFQLHNEREQRAVLMVRRGEKSQPGVRLAFKAQSERLGQSRFADPRLCGDQDDLTPPGFRLRPSAAEQLDLLIAPDKWRLPCAQRFKAAACWALPDDAKGRNQ